MPSRSNSSSSKWSSGRLQFLGWRMQELRSSRRFVAFGCNKNHVTLCQKIKKVVTSPFKM